MAASTLQLAQPFLIEQDTANTRGKSGRCGPELWPPLAATGTVGVDEYLDGTMSLASAPTRFPIFATFARRLSPRTGWETTPVSGLCRLTLFSNAGRAPFSYDDLAAERNSMDYTPEPDIFHGRVRHVPMHRIEVR